jgi:hypothetical protein
MLCSTEIKFHRSLGSRLPSIAVAKYATGCVVMSDQIEPANRHAIHGAKTLYGNFGRAGTEFGGKWQCIK